NGRRNFLCVFKSAGFAGAAAPCLLPRPGGAAGVSPPLTAQLRRPRDSPSVASGADDYAQLSSCRRSQHQAGWSERRLGRANRPVLSTGESRVLRSASLTERVRVKRSGPGFSVWRAACRARGRVCRRAPRASRGQGWPLGHPEGLALTPARSGACSTTTFELL